MKQTELQWTRGYLSKPDQGHCPSQAYLHHSPSVYTIGKPLETPMNRFFTHFSSLNI